MLGSPKSSKSMKNKYHVRSTHRRSASQPVGKEDDWSGEDGSARIKEGGGRHARSFEVGGIQSSGVMLFMGDKEESVADSQLRVDEGTLNTLKVLAAKRELGIQNIIGVSHSLEEGGIIEKLVHLEEVAVKIKAKMGESRLLL